MSVLHSTFTTAFNRSEVKRVRRQECCGTSMLWGFFYILCVTPFNCNDAVATRCDLQSCQNKTSHRLKKKLQTRKGHNNSKEKQAGSSLELKYNLRRCIYSHTFNKLERCNECLSIWKENKKNKGKVSVTSHTSRESIQQQNSQCRCVSQSTKCCPE